MKEYITFQTVDNDGDIWCNEAFIFEADEQVEKFFTNAPLVLKTLEIELDYDAGETLENIKYNITRTYRRAAAEGAIIRVEFDCNWGTVEICRMRKGIMIGEQK